ncbi:hypothetical protein [Streptomyces iconiensis]|uniref:Mce-associated membrane protein n=1 Tax=Streptomyces iconiensis TaxID=1384038 RepID=A0ABT7A8A1_9ACTN|nr:hypothetical protein [Streptomyces iconiensis]MDJ1137568.1 hypothetical protein [Streptomyces iconiensis]
MEPSEAEPSEAESGPDEPGQVEQSRTPRRAPGASGAPRASGTLWLAGALAAALLFVAFSGWIHWTARSDKDLAYSQARDEALAAGRTHIATLNSIDAKGIRADMKDWREATTGPLRDELRRTEKKSARTLAERGTSARARVTAAALTSLDERAGTAALIATVRIEATTRAGAPATDRKRFEAGLERTPDGWKLVSLAPVPVGKGS